MKFGIGKFIYPSFQASAAKYMRVALFWVITPPAERLGIPDH
jgi:hypothetical protein